MPVKKFQDPLQMVVSKKNLKAPNAEPKATPPDGNILKTQQNGIHSQKSSNTLTLRERTPNGGLLAEPISNSSEPTKRYNRDYLKDRWQTLSGRMMDWLHQGNRLEDMMAETKLRDIGVMLGIATEKVLLLEGQPTSIIGQAESKKLEDLIPALLLEVKRRGIKADVTERKVSLEVPPHA